MSALAPVAEPAPSLQPGSNAAVPDQKATRKKRAIFSLSMR
jgi:hypothetical protein